MDETYDLGTGITIISIVLEEGEPPKIELDGCDPDVAAAIFRRAADILNSTAIYPTITSKGEEIIADDFVIYFDDDDYDE